MTGIRKSGMTGQKSNFSAAIQHDIFAGEMDRHMTPGIPTLQLCSEVKASCHEFVYLHIIPEESKLSKER